MLKKTLLAASAVIALGAASPVTPPSLQLGKLAKLGTVDTRYQGFNVEMVEVTGGRFWAPYGPAGTTSPEMFRQRGPLDLTDPRLIAYARNLRPSLMRVSGTWSNNTYLEAEGEHLSAPPEGYKQVMTRQQWASVVAFSKAVDAPIVTSFAVSGGTRGPDGVWRTDQAQRVLNLTRAEGGTLYAAEFFNEPNIPSAAVGMPKGYSASDYAAELRIFRDWVRKTIPAMKILGPGGSSEGSMFMDRKRNDPDNPMLAGHIDSEDLMKANPRSLDAVTYHFYGSVSQRCGVWNAKTAVKADALTPAWLDRTVLDSDFYGALRDKYEPGKPLWNTETAQAACGGSPWASTFLDSFRYLNQLGVLAQKGVQIVLHNTLATSDYALLERETMTPRPNYWAAVLWHRTMGPTVLASPKSPSPALRLFAHCMPGKVGGVTVMALNTGEAAQRINLAGKGQGWTMTGQPVDTRQIKVNDVSPALGHDGNLTGLNGVPVAGAIRIPGQAIGFDSLPSANNPACR